MKKFKSIFSEILDLRGVEQWIKMLAKISGAFLLGRILLFGEISPLAYIAAVSAGGILVPVAAILATWRLKYVLAYAIYIYSVKKRKEKPIVLAIFALAIAGSLDVALRGFSMYSAILLPLECGFAGGSLWLISHYKKQAKAPKSAIDSVCYKCKKATECWIRNFNQTRDIINHAQMAQREDFGSVNFPDYFKCEKVDELKYALEYERQKECVNGEVEFLPAIEAELQYLFLQKGVRVRNVIAIRNRNNSFELDFTIMQAVNEGIVLDVCERATGRKMRIAEVEVLHERRKLRILERANFALSLGIAGVGIGDNYSYAKSERCAVITLSDGMGQGALAGKYSALTVDLMQKFINAGFTKTSSVNLLNSVLKLGANESFATVDIAMINLYTGAFEMLKLGANASYLISKNGVRKIMSRSYPAGILGTVDMEIESGVIGVGDCLIMISDGIENAQEPWIARFVTSERFGNEQHMAERILNEARNRALSCGKSMDDMLCVVTRIRENVSEVGYVEKGA